MKMNDKSLSNNELDYLLFDHLEGNLSDDLSAELIRKSMIDYAIEDELNCWKRAYVDQECYDTASLEEKLFRIPSDINKNIRTNTYFFAIAVFTVILNFVPLSFDSQNDKDQSVISESMISDAPDETEVPNFASLNPYKAVDSKAMVVEKVALVSVEKINEQKRVHHEIIPLESSGVAATKAAPNIGAKIAFINTSIRQTTADRAIKRSTGSRKARRAIEKSMEKTLQERKAMEFMRGNKAYLVPLNSNF